MLWVVSYEKCFRQKKEFWKIKKPFLFDKNTIYSQINREKNDKIISDDFHLSEEFGTFSKDAVWSLNVKPDEYYLSETENLSNPVNIAIKIKMLEKHPSVLAIKQNISVIQNFYFSNTDVSDILKETPALNNGTFCNIPRKQLIEVSDIYIPRLNNIRNKEIITQKSFLNHLKLADVTPVFKKDDVSYLKNYKPVSVLEVESKVYERIMQKPILDYIDKHLSPYFCGYRKDKIHKQL